MSVAGPFAFSPLPPFRNGPIDRQMTAAAPLLPSGNGGQRAVAIAAKAQPARTTITTKFSRQLTALRPGATPRNQATYRAERARSTDHRCAKPNLTTFEKNLPDFRTPPYFANIVAGELRAHAFSYPNSARDFPFRRILRNGEGKLKVPSAAPWTRPRKPFATVSSAPSDHRWPNGPWPGEKTAYFPGKTGQMARHGIWPSHRRRRCAHAGW